MQKYILLIAIVFLIAYIKCGSNNAPLITSVSADPTSTYPNEEVTLTVQADDEDGDALSYYWSAEDGSFSATDLSSVIWTAPEDTGTYAIEIIVEDEGGLADTGGTNIVVRPNWVEGSNMTPVGIYDFTWTYSEIILSGAPSGSEVDTVAIAVNITHSWPSDLDIWLESPDGTQLLIWDNNYPGGAELFITDFFAGKGVNGTWLLWIYDEVAGDEGTLNGWSISVLWKF